MTTEEKAALVKHAQKWIKEAEAARDDIPFGFDDDTEKELSLIKTALASLTAEVHSYTFDEACLPLYTVPPMPEIPTGWRLVPVEPDAAMRLASKRYKASTKVTTGPGFYRAMIAASKQLAPDNISEINDNDQKKD